MYSLIYVLGNRLGQRLRSGLNWLVMNKVLRLRGGKGGKTGQILNMISGDGDRLIMGAPGLGAVFVQPFILITAAVIGLVVIGWPSLLGTFIVFLSIPAFILFGKFMMKCRMAGCDLSGKRIELSSEVLSSLRLIKMFNWEDYFYNRILKIREQESLCYYKMNTATCVLYGSD